MSSKGTALVTGASFGIGEAFCRALARDGYDLVLVARRREPLEKLAEELRLRHGIEAEAFPADLASDEDAARVARRIEEAADLSMLVNNAGNAVEGNFVDTDIERQLESIRLHDLAVTRLTHAALPGMIARRGGGIVNLSSMAAFFPSTGNVVYNAAKAFTVAFTETLSLELKGTGVRVQALCPGFTHTAFHSSMGVDVSHVPERMWMSADEVVEESLRALERGRRGKVVFIPGRANRLVGLLFNLPRPVVYHTTALLDRILVALKLK
jgi:short-subunit dehydrogenase